MSGPEFQPACLTIDFSARAFVIVTDAAIGHHHQIGAAPPAVGFQPCKAIWDTGASATVVTQRIVNAVGLKPISMAMTRGIHGEKMANVYYVALRLPNDVVFPGLRVTEGDLGSDADVLIGMDVIAAGDFAITNKGGATTFSFRLPSMEKIDFNKQPPPKPSPLVNHVAKVGRNDPCPCGSGKKYKHCCMH